MNELIKVTPNEKGEQTVSARELHEFIQSKQDFSTWIKARIDKYGFIENQDFIRIHKKMEANNATIIEYAITIDVAKELSMVEANDNGREARRYFIKCEKAALEIHKRLASPREMAQMVIEAENAKEALQLQLDIQKPKVLFADSVSESKDSVLIKELVGYLKQNGIDIGQNRLFEWLRQHSYFCGSRC